MLPNFFSLTGSLADPVSARFALLPVPYEGTVSYGSGTSGGPRALLEASEQLEDYDELLGLIPTAEGVITWQEPELPDEPAGAVVAVREAVESVLDLGKYPVIIGGEHSISYGCYQAFAASCPQLGVIQFDAHADLRNQYQGSPFSHACVMARIREETTDVLQLGIRSLSSGEAASVKNENLQLGLLHQIRAGSFDWRTAVDRMPPNIYLTFDVDVLDLAIVRATGTPEPGGLTWDESNEMLQYVFSTKKVVGFDLVELCGGDTPSAFCAARLVSRMMGFVVKHQ